MSDSQAPAAVLEELLIKAADGDRPAISQIIETVTAAPVLDDAAGETLKQNLEMVIDDPKKAAADEQLSTLAVELAKRGFELLLVRDVLAALSREQYQEYADPAGMIRAMGVNNERVDIRAVVERFEMFALLAQGLKVWHDSYNFGVIDEIDALTGNIQFTFNSRQSFTLQQSLENLNFVVPGSLVDEFLQGNGSFDRETAPDEFDRQVADSFSPPLVSTRLVVEKLLVPKFLGPREFISWRDRKPKTKKKSPKQTVTNPTGAALEEITWENARSLHELKLELAKVKKIKLTAAHVPHYLRLYKFSGPKPHFAQDYGETLSQMWKLAPRNDEHLLKLLEQLPQDAVAMNEGFVDVVIGMKSKMIDHWFQVCWRVRGKEWFLEVMTELPLKYWPAAEALLAEFDVPLDEISQVCLRKLRDHKARSDVVVWLWRKEVPEAAPLLANPRLVLDALGQEAKGEFIRGRKLLHGLLLNDEDFQSALMDNGKPEGIESFVRNVRGGTALDLNDQKVLLVKICRIYPNAKKYVEERRRDEPATREMPKRSSFRSVDARREELQDIISKKIPANSAAISQARSYGDLRENFEYKAAKDEQRLLLARREELEADLVEIQPTDFSDVEISNTVMPGVSVELSVEGESEVYHVLGLWDSDPERRIISYDTPLGKALVGREVGTVVQMPQGKEAEIVAVNELPADIKSWLGHA